MSLHSHACYNTYPNCSPILHHPSIWHRVQLTKLRLCNLIQLPLFLPSLFHTFSQNSVIRHLQSMKSSTHKFSSAGSIFIDHRSHSLLFCLGYSSSVSKMWNLKTSLPYSQRPTPQSVHEPEKFSPHFHTLFL